MSKYEIRVKGLPFITLRMVVLLKKQAKNFKVGKYHMGHGIIANVDPEFQTKESSSVEVHQEYADFAVVLKGEEGTRIYHTRGLQPLLPYDPEKDIAFFADNDEYVTVHHLRPGKFCLVYPKEGHMPGMQYYGEDTVRKIVFKIPKRLLNKWQTPWNRAMAYLFNLQLKKLYRQWLYE